MKRLLVALVSAAALIVWSLPFEVDVARAAPSVLLNPSSGDPPSVSGTLSGANWLCSGPGSGPVGTVTVTGSGVTGTGDINRDGSLTGGSFIVSFRGSYAVDVTVKANTACPAIVPVYLQATATFTFRAPTSTPAPTNTLVPSPTPSPASTSTPSPATAPAGPTDTPAPGVTPPTTVATSIAESPSPAGATATDTAVAGATPTPASQPPPGEQFLLFDGCVPAAPVSLEFVPLNLVGPDPPDPKATGPGISVPAVQANDGSGRLAFKPPDVEPRRLFRVTSQGGDADCAPDPAQPEAYWVSGRSLVFRTRLKSAVTLEICLPGDISPCEYPEVKGAFIHRGDPPSYRDTSDAAFAASAWGTDKNYVAGGLAKGKQRFRSSTDLAVAGSGKLQASVLPFPKGAESDPSSVPGLVASWDIACVNCEFTVDLSPLAPPPPHAKKPWYKSVGGAIAKPFKLTGQGVGYVWGKLEDLVGIGGGGKSGKNVVGAGKPTIPATKPGDYLVGGAANVLLKPTTFYFRLIVPLESNPKTSAASNPVRMQEVEKEPEVVIPNPTPTVEPPYDVKIVGYHGIIPPLNESKHCYIATQDAWPKTMPIVTYTTKKSEAVTTDWGVKKGQLLCEPDPHPPSILEAIVSWAQYIIDWASQAWTDLKNFAIDVVLKYTPLGALCKTVEGTGKIPGGTCASAFHVALDAALVTLGIPPDIPNFHELMDQGIDYLAAQTAAQVGIPPEVVKQAVAAGGPLAGMALDEAEAELRKQLQAQIKAKLSDAATQVELGYASKVGWLGALYSGVPVKPDDFQPPAMTVVVTRKAGVPGGDNGCELQVVDSVQLDKATLDNPPAGYASFLQGLPSPLSAGTSYDLFGNESGLGTDKSLSVPPLADGQSYTIPMTFKPNYYKSGWSPLGTIPTDTYIGVWRFLHDFGMLHLGVGGCGSAMLDVPAKAAVLIAQVVP